MTITTASDFTYMRIASDFITDWIEEDPTHTFSISLIVSKGCATADNVTIDLDEDNLDMDGEYYELVPSDLGQDTTFTDGVYSIVVRKVITSSGSSSEDVGCKFIDITTGCDVMDYTADNLDSDLIAFYTALSTIGICAQCICANACVIYDYIANKLSLNTTSTNATNSDCGCS